MLGARSSTQFWPTRGVTDTAQDNSVLDNAFVLIDGIALFDPLPVRFGAPGSDLGGAAVRAVALLGSGSKKPLPAREWAYTSADQRRL